MLVKRYLGLLRRDWAPCLPRLVQEVVTDKSHLLILSSPMGSLRLRLGVRLGQGHVWPRSDISTDDSSSSSESHTSRPKKGGSSWGSKPTKDLGPTGRVIFLHRGLAGDRSHPFLPGRGVGWQEARAGGRQATFTLSALIYDASQSGVLSFHSGQENRTEQGWSVPSPLEKLFLELRSIKARGMKGKVSKQTHPAFSTPSPRLGGRFCLRALPLCACRRPKHSPGLCSSPQA